MRSWLPRRCPNCNHPSSDQTPKFKLTPAVADASPDGLQLPMIQRFRHNGLERLFTKGDLRGVDPQQVRKLRALWV